VDVADGFHVDHEAAGHLRLAEGRVPLPARRDLDAALAAELHHLLDVTH